MMFQICVRPWSGRVGAFARASTSLIADCGRGRSALLLLSRADPQVRDGQGAAPGAVYPAGELLSRLLDLEREEQRVPALRAGVLQGPGRHPDGETRGGVVVS